jgi:hypothetical protein
VAVKCFPETDLLRPDCGGHVSYNPVFRPQLGDLFVVSLKRLLVSGEEVDAECRGNRLPDRQRQPWDDCRLVHT